MYTIGSRGRGEARFKKVPTRCHEVNHLLKPFRRNSIKYLPLRIHLLYSAPTLPPKFVLVLALKLLFLPVDDEGPGIVPDAHSWRANIQPEDNTPMSSALSRRTLVDGGTLPLCDEIYSPSGRGTAT